MQQLAQWTTQAATKFQAEPFALKPEQMMSITSRDLLDVQSSPRIPEMLLREQEVLYQKFLFLKKIGKIPETASWAKVRGSINLAMLREVMADSDRYALRGFDYRGNTETDGTR
jgi:NitT/TauT family transport system substrate-binding protein